MPGSVFVPRLARRVAAQPGGGSPRRTGPDHRGRHAAVAAARGPGVHAPRVRDHAAPPAGHPAHVVAAGPDARLQGPSAQDHGPVHGTCAGRVRRGPGHHLQPGRSAGRRTCRAAAVAAVAAAASNRFRLGRRRTDDSARSPRRRRGHQKPRPRPDPRYPVTAGRPVGPSSRRVTPADGERRRIFFFRPETISVRRHERAVFIAIRSRVGGGRVRRIVLRRKCDPGT